MSSNIRRGQKKRRRSVNLLKLRKPSAGRIEMPDLVSDEFLADKANTEKLKNVIKGVSSVSARKEFGGSYAAATADMMVQSGGFDLLKQGFIQMRTGKKRAFKDKFAVMEKGILNIYNTKNVVSGTTVPTVLPPETSLNLLDLRALGYAKRGSTVFALVVGVEERRSEKKGRSRGNNNGLLRMRKRSSVSRATSNSNSSTFTPKNTSAKEMTYFFRCNSRTDTEVWLTALLAEVKNQAQFLELTATRMFRSDGRLEIIERILRQCVDLFQISVGKTHKSTLHAQERLAKFLKREDSESLEGRFWHEVAQTTRKKLRKLEKQSMGNYILDRARLIRPDSPMSQMQFQTEALYKLKAYKTKVIQMRAEAKKWKARAILSGYGDNRAKKIDDILEQKIELAIDRKSDSEDELFHAGRKESVNTSLEINQKSKRTERTRSRRLPSVLTGTDPEGDSDGAFRNDSLAFDKEEAINIRNALFDGEKVSEAGTKSKRDEDDIKSKDSKVIPKRSYVRPLTFDREVEDPPRVRKSSKDMETENAQVKAKNTKKERGSVNLSTLERLERDEPFVETQVDGVEDSPSHPEFRRKKTSQLVQEFFKEEERRQSENPVDEKEIVREEIEVPHTMLSRNTIDDIEEKPPKDKPLKDEHKELLENLNTIEGRKGKDVVSVSLDILKEEYVEMKKPPVQKAYKKEPVNKEKEKKPACYLLFSPHNKGTLYMRWSKRDLSEQALMKFVPDNPKKIPSYYYRVRSGIAPAKKDELGSHVLGSSKKMAKGVNQFIKQSRKYNASITIIQANVNFRVFGYSEADGRIEELEGDEELNTLFKQYGAIGTLPAHSSVFEGLHFMPKTQFMSKARRQGAAMELKI